MPHIIVEYSDNLSAHVDIQSVVQALYETLCARQDAEIDPDRVLVRAYETKHYVLGTQKTADFLLIIQLLLVKGRSWEMMKSLAADLQEKAREIMADHNIEACVTAEPIELSEGYCSLRYRR